VTKSHDLSLPTVCCWRITWVKGGNSKLPTTGLKRKLIIKRGKRGRLMRRRAKRIREGQARERKKEGNPAYFGAYVKTRFRKTAASIE